MKKLLSLIFLIVTACGSSEDTSPTPINYVDANEWEIGPILDGKNYSHNAPLHPTQIGNNWAIEFPTKDGVHYVTAKASKLYTTDHIIIDYKIEADPGAKFLASSDGASYAIGPTPYFQACHDDWNTDGKRWWATFITPAPMVPGEFHMDVPLSSRWSSVEKMDQAKNPDAFQKSIDDVCRIGITFGGGTGYGHGSFISGGHARVIVEKFEVQHGN